MLFSEAQAQRMELAQIGLRDFDERNAKGQGIMIFESDSNYIPRLRTEQYAQPDALPTDLNYQRAAQRADQLYRYTA